MLINLDPLNPPGAFQTETIKYFWGNYWYNFSEPEIKNKSAPLMRHKARDDIQKKCLQDDYS